MNRQKQKNNQRRQNIQQPVVLENRGQFNNYGNVHFQGQIRNYGTVNNFGTFQGSPYTPGQQQPRPAPQQYNVYQQYNYSPQYNPAMHTNYVAPQHSAQNPHAQPFTRANALTHMAQNRAFTPEEQKNVAEIEKLQPFCNSLSKDLKGTVGTFSKLNPAEKAFVATLWAPRLNKDETVQDVKRVMHVLTDDNEKNYLPAPSKRAFKQEKSFFVGDPKVEIQEPRLKSMWPVPAQETTPKSFTLLLDVQLSPDTKELSTWDKLAALPKIS